ncbi:hypothetical protein Tco_0191078 [Tanacetum coccineum]
MEDDVDINTLTIEQYLAWVKDDIRPGVVKPKIGNDIEFDINSNFMRELKCKLFKGTDDEDAHERVWRVLEIADLFHFPDVTHVAVMLRVFPITLKGPALRWISRLSAGIKVHIFYTGLDIPTRRVLDSKGFIPLMKPTQALISIQVMAEHSHNWYDEATTREQINDSPNNVDTKKPKENIHAIQASNPHRSCESICPIEIPKEINEDEGNMNDGCDITVEDVERLRKILTPPIYALPNLKPITVHITPPDNDYVASATNPILNKHLNEFRDEFADNTRVSKMIDSNLVNDLKELLKTYDFENFIRKFKHQLSQSSHETGSLYKKVEFEVPLTRIHVVVRFCLGVTT